MSSPLSNAISAMNKATVKPMPVSMAPAASTPQESSVVLCAWLARHSMTRHQPFIDVRMLARNRPLLTTYLRAGTMLMMVYCMLYGFAQWLESAAGYSGTKAGLITIPMSIVRREQRAAVEMMRQKADADTPSALARTFTPLQQRQRDERRSLMAKRRLERLAASVPTGVPCIGRHRPRYP